MAGRYSNIENLVLWARSEKIGCAENESHGKMKEWNAGLLGLVDKDLILYK
jgi:hypothetical protein